MDSLTQTLLTADARLFHLINTQLTAAWLDPVMKALSGLGHWRWTFYPVWAALMIFGSKRDRQLGLLMIVLMLTTDFISGHLLKPWFARPRPYRTLVDARLLLDAPFPVNNFGFPSSHAFNSAAVTTLIAWAYYKKHKAIAALALLTAVLISYSRVYLGVHYPSDVVAGIFLGGLAGTGAYKAFERLLKPVDSSPRFPVGPPAGEAGKGREK